MAARRTYRDSCGIARALDLVGERWALLVVRELLLGPKRFSDLRSGLPGVSADILAARLRELEAAGVVRRDQLPPPAAARVYALTERGRELEPILLGLGRWGSRTPFPEGAPDLGADSMVLALKTLFSPEAAEGVHSSVEVRLGEHRFHARVDDGRFEVTRGGAEDPEVTIDTDSGTLAAVLWRGRPVADLRIDGPKRAARSFLRLFPAAAG